MIETPQIVEIPAQLLAAVHIHVPRSEIEHVMGPAIGEATGAVETQGVGPAGPWFTHHLDTTSDVFDFDVCVPVFAPIKPVGRVKPAQHPAVTVARTMYHGPYEGLGDAWHAFSAWLETNGYRTADDFYECYRIGPEASADPADWRTELRRQLL